MHGFAATNARRASIAAFLASVLLAASPAHAQLESARLRSGATPTLPLSNVVGSGQVWLLVSLNAEGVVTSIDTLSATAPSTAAPVPARCGSPRPGASPRLSVPFAVKGRGFEQSADVAGQHVVRGGADRPTPPTRRPGRCRLPPRIHARAGAAPHAADPLHAIRPPRGDRVGVLHRLDLRRAKGPPTSNWSTFA